MKISDSHLYNNEENSTLITIKSIKTVVQDLNRERDKGKVFKFVKFSSFMV